MHGMGKLIYSRGKTQRWENSCVGRIVRLLVCGIIGNGEKKVTTLQPLQALVRKLFEWSTV